MKYYLISGEASGDLHGANLIRSLRAVDSEADFRFYGGDLMRAAGGTLVRHYRDTAVMGFVSVIANARKILRNIKDCKNDIAAYKPDALILIDYPGFNLKIAKYAKYVLSLKVFYYIPPKVWAWKEGRVKAIGKYCDKVYGIFPFESDFYATRGCNTVNYVGNPCVQAVNSFLQSPQRTDFCKANKLPEDKKIIALLPGSRKQEVAQTIKFFNSLDTTPYEDCIFVVAATAAVDPALYNSLDSRFRIVKDQTYPLLAAAYAALVNSGTATLETALFGVPQAVCYPMRVPALLYRPGRKILLKIPFVSLVNIICGKEAVKEFVGPDLTKDSVEKELHRLVYEKQYRQAIAQDYENLAAKLGGNIASDEAAGSIFRTLCCK